MSIRLLLIAILVVCQSCGLTFFDSDPLDASSGSDICKLNIKENTLLSDIEAITASKSPEAFVLDITSTNVGVARITFPGNKSSHPSLGKDLVVLPQVVANDSHPSDQGIGNFVKNSGDSRFVPIGGGVRLNKVSNNEIFGATFSGQDSGFYSEISGVIDVANAENKRFFAGFDCSFSGGKNPPSPTTINVAKPAFTGSETVVAQTILPNSGKTLNWDKFLGIEVNATSQDLLSLYGDANKVETDGEYRTFYFFDSTLRILVRDNEVALMTVRKEFLDGAGLSFMKSKGFDTTAIEVLRFDGKKVIEVFGQPVELENSFYDYEVNDDIDFKYFCLDYSSGDSACLSMTVRR